MAWINGQWVDEDELQGMLSAGTKPTWGGSTALPFYDQPSVTSPLSTLNQEATGISGMFTGQATDSTPYTNPQALAATGTVLGGLTALEVAKRAAELKGLISPKHMSVYGPKTFQSITNKPGMSIAKVLGTGLTVPAQIASGLPMMAYSEDVQTPMTTGDEVPLTNEQMHALAGTSPVTGILPPSVLAAQTPTKLTGAGFFPWGDNYQADKAKALADSFVPGDPNPIEQPMDFYDPGTTGGVVGDYRVGVGGQNKVSPVFASDTPFANPYASGGTYYDFDMFNKDTPVKFDVPGLGFQTDPTPTTFSSDFYDPGSTASPANIQNMIAGGEIGGSDYVSPVTDQVYSGVDPYSDIGYPSAIGTSYGAAGVNMNTPFGVQFSGGVPTIEDEALTTPMFSPLDLFGGLPALGKWGAKTVGKALTKSKKTESFSQIKDKLAEDLAKKLDYTSVDAMNKAAKAMGTPDWSLKATRSSFAQPKGYVDPKDIVHSLVPLPYSDISVERRAIEARNEQERAELSLAASLEDMAVGDTEVPPGVSVADTGGFIQELLGKINDARTIGPGQVGVNKQGITFTVPTKTQSVVTAGPVEKIPRPPDIAAQRAAADNAARIIARDTAAQAETARQAQIAQEATRRALEKQMTGWLGRDEQDESAMAQIQAALDHYADLQGTGIFDGGRQGGRNGDRASVGIDAGGKYGGGGPS